MLQLRRIRTYTKNNETKEYDTCFEPDILVESHAELFQNLQSYIDKIPQFERYNCHYTLGESIGGKKRGKGNFLSQSLVPFDVDGVVLTAEKEQNKKIIGSFIDTFFETTGFSRKDTVVIFSGGGLHFLIQTATWTDRDYFKKHSKAYSGLCLLLEQNFKKVNLEFKELDRMVFTPNHMLRLPDTINRKPGKKDRPCLLLEGSLAPQTVDWTKFAKVGLKESAKAKDTPSPEKRFAKVDSAAVEDGCAFLKACKSDPAKVTEAQWYASLSILARLENGKEKCHEYSRGHPGYDPAACDEKIQNNLDSAGPWNCATIANLGTWCGECPHNGKIDNPLKIKSVDFIATEHTGFHREEMVGENLKLTPAYDDLRKFFAREASYKTSEENGAVWAWDGKKYDIYPYTRLRGFAGEHFQPQPMERHIVEFINRVTRVNHVPQSFFEGRPGCINFANGVLDLEKKELATHSPEDGFIWVLPYEYDATAMCPEFDAMMKRISCNDEEVEQLLLEVIGDAVCDRTYWEQLGTILVGEGSNGKSFFMDVVKMLVGKSNFSAISIKEMESPVKRHMLKGSLVNLCDEMPNLKNTDTEVFKKVTGGDILIERKYQDPITMRCSTKLIFATNELPVTNDHTRGLLRRMNLIPFDARFDKNNRDLKLKEKIELELPGIFNKVLKAYETLRIRGKFLEPNRSKQLLKTFKDNNDVVGSFLEEELTWTPGPWDKDDYVTFTDVMLAVKPHAMLHNERFVSGRKVVAALKRLIPDFEQRITRKWSKDSGKHDRAYFGVKFHRPPDDIHVNGNGANGADGFGSKMEGVVPARGLDGSESLFA